VQALVLALEPVQTRGAFARLCSTMMCHRMSRGAGAWRACAGTARAGAAARGCDQTLQTLSGSRPYPDPIWPGRAQGRVGEDKLVQLCKDGGLEAGKLLAADPEFDPADLPDPAAFLKSKGLGALPL